MTRSHLELTVERIANRSIPGHMHPMAGRPGDLHAADTAARLGSRLGMNLAPLEA